MHRDDLVEVLMKGSKAAFTAFWWIHLHGNQVLTYEPIAATIVGVVQPEFAPVLASITAEAITVVKVVNKIAENKTIFGKIVKIAY